MKLNPSFLSLIHQLSNHQFASALNICRVAQETEAAARDQLRAGLLRDMATLTDYVVKQWRDSQQEQKAWLSTWL